MVAEAETYGADKLWVVLKPIPIELDSDSESGSSSPTDDDVSDDEPGAAGSSQGPGKRPRV